MTTNKKAGIAPGLSLFVDGRVTLAKTRFALMPGHDIYDVTSLPHASAASPATT